MPTEGVPGYLNYRIVNRITGVEVVHDLPHLHQSTWTVRAMQLGAPGSSAIGDFRIPLHPPRSEGFRAAKAFYDQLDYGLRVEGYLGPVGAGTPRYAGIIRGITKSFGKYEIEGLSDVWVAHATKAFPGQYLCNGNAASTTTNIVVTRFLKLNTDVFRDDFSSYNAANYTVTGAWSSTTDEGIAAVTIAAGADKSLRRTTTAVDVPGLIEVSGRITTNSTDATNAGMVGFGHPKDTGGTAALAGYALVVRYNAGTTLYDLDVRTFTLAEGGASSAVVTTSNVFTGVSMPFKFQFALSLTSTGQAAGTAGARLYLNGKDTGALTGLGPILYPPTGEGAYLYYNAPATGTTTAYFNEFLVGHQTTAGFTSGTTSTGTQTIQLATATAGQSFLDIWTEMATMEGWYWRYTPKTVTAALGALGTVDYGATPGTDLSTSASGRFIEGDNLVDVQISPNADAFATSVRLAGLPGSAAGSPGALGGTLVWRNFTAMGTYGWLEDNVPSTVSTDASALRLAAQQIVANKTNLNAAKVATVLRDPATADKWRELDYVTVHAPSLGLNYLKALVVGYDFTEGSTTQQVWLDQFAGVEVPWLRASASAEYLANGFAGRQ